MGSTRMLRSEKVAVVDILDLMDRFADERWGQSPVFQRVMVYE